MNNQDRPALADVMEQHPLLSDYGIGVYDPAQKSLAQRESELAESREKLAAKEDRVLEIVEWLNTEITPISTPRVSSYHMKHVMERATGRYSSNGEFIAAALIAGYTYKYADDEPNPLLGMSVRDEKRLMGN